MRKKLLIILLPGVIAFLLFYYMIFVQGLKKDVVIDIETGTGLSAIASQLKSRKVIKSENLFLALTMLKGSYRDLKAGEYEFRKGESLNSIVNKIIEGRVRLRKITVPEGKNIYEISGILSRNSIADRSEFMSLATDSQVVQDITDTNSDSLEGYLYPDTYYFPKNAGPLKVINSMTDHFFRVFEELKSKEARTWLSDREVIILASMIEKETGYDSERDIISSVFHNRLRVGMKLDCDPTVIYGLLPDFDGNLTKRDLRSTDNPYNTYTRRGLPPGPIANPGRKSLEAALNPADTEYFYFVSKGDGSHKFSKTYNEHIKAVNRHIRNN